MSVSAAEPARPLAGKRIGLVANTSWNLLNFRAPLIEALREAGAQVHLFAPEDAHIGVLQARGWSWTPLPMQAHGTNPLQDLRLAARMARQFCRARLDAVLLYTIKPVIYGALAARWIGIPAIATITGLGAAFTRRDWTNRIVRQLYRASLAGTRAVFFQNDDDRDLFLAQGLVAAARTRRVAGSGVDLSHFHASRYPDDGDGPRFLLVARALRDKGLAEYAEAARRLHVRWPRARFQWLGDAGGGNPAAIDQNELKHWVDAGIIEPLGFAADVRPHLAAAHCVVLPSYREGTPRVLLEALATGRPIVTTDAPGCRDLFDPAHGWQCDVASADSLEAALRHVLEASNEMRARMGEAGRRWVAEHYDAAKVASHYLDALAAVLSPAGRERE